jgi:hypothetical protein
VPDDKLKVLFVCEAPDYRCYKMAKGLLATGECEPYLLAARWDDAQHRSAFAGARKFGGIFWRAFHASWVFDPFAGPLIEPLAGPVLNRWMTDELAKAGADIVHTITPPVGLSRLAIGCAGAPTVFDQYDLILQSYGEGHPRPREIAHERWCFEHAGGYVHKGPKREMDFYRDRGYRMAGPELSLPDGCDESLFQPLGGRKLSDDDGEWHIVYAGGIHGPGKPHYLLREFEAMAAQGIHTHVYPARWSRDHECLGCYAEAGAKNGKIHVHGTKPYVELVRELSMYDFGLYYFDIDPVRFPALAGNKIPTYFEAGIPVIVGEKLAYSAGFVRADGAGLVVSADDVGRLGDLLDAGDAGAMAAGVGRARERLSLKIQGRTLLEFYRKLAGARNI